MTDSTRCERTAADTLLFVGTKPELDQHIDEIVNDALEAAARLVEGYERVARKPKTWKEIADEIRSIGPGHHG